MGEMTDDYDAYPYDPPPGEYTVRQSPTGRFIIGMDPAQPHTGVNYFIQGGQAFHVQRQIETKDLGKALQSVDAGQMVYYLDVDYPGIEERILEYAERDVQLTFEMMYGDKIPDIQDWGKAKFEEDKMRDPEVLRRQAYKMLQEADFYESVPEEDPFEDGTVIKFSKKFVGSTVGAYHFAALKVPMNGDEPSRWYITGARQNTVVYNWQQLVEFIGRRGLESAIVMLDGKSLIDFAKEMADKPSIESGSKESHDGPMEPGGQFGDGMK